jgi:adenylate kinase
VPQAQAFSNGVSNVVHLKVSDKEALWRIAGRLMEAGVAAREDETLAAIRKRIQMFHEFTEPVIEYYRQQGRLTEVDGEREVDAIFSDICAHLEASKE